VTETCHRGVSYSSAGNDQGYHRRRIDQGENQAPVKRRNITGDTLHAISNDRTLQGKFQRNNDAGSPFVWGQQTYTPGLFYDATNIQAPDRVTGHQGAAALPFYKRTQTHRIQSDRSGSPAPDRLL